MLVKQKNLRVFEIEIDDEVEFFNYVNKNFIILQKFLLLLRGNISENIIKFLNDNKMIFFDVNNIIDINSVISNAKFKSVETNKTDKKEEQIEVKRLIFNRTIRSGEEIICSDDVVIFGRVNSGAKIITTGNVEVFGMIDGMIESSGDYLIAKEIGSGDIIFNGEVINKAIFNSTIRQISFKNGSLMVKEL